MIVTSHGAAVLRGCGCVCMQVDADLWGTAKFVDSVRLPYIAPSLGGVDSLIEQPTVISYWDQARPCTTLLFTDPIPQPLCPKATSKRQEVPAQLRAGMSFYEMVLHVV